MVFRSCCNAAFNPSTSQTLEHTCLEIGLEIWHGRFHITDHFHFTMARQAFGQYPSCVCDVDPMLVWDVWDIWACFILFPAGLGLKDEFGPQNLHFSARRKDRHACRRWQCFQTFCILCKRKLSYRRERCIIQQTAEQRLGPYPTSWNSWIPLQMLTNMFAFRPVAFVFFQPDFFLSHFLYTRRCT